VVATPGRAHLLKFNLQSAICNFRVHIDEAVYCGAVTPPCIVLIAPADLLPPLIERTADAAAELLTFSNTETLRALETITRRRPQVVALERLFAATSRGAALINRIKADPALAASEIRVIAHDSDYSRVSPRRPPAAAQALDRTGTRLAPRFELTGSVRVTVDGRPAAIVDLSVNGAQVASPAQLNPKQRVQMILGDGHEEVSCTADVAWAKFEIPLDGRPRYRAGVALVAPAAAALDLLIARNRLSS
jgi:hypothetical protein